MRRAPLAAVALAAVAIALTAASCGPSTEGIATGDVQRATVTEVVDAPASVTAKGLATLTAPADGTLASLAVAPGQQVAKDQIVAVIDSPSARKRLADAQAALAAADSVGAAFPTVDLSSVQNGLDAAAAESFTAARAAAAKVADGQLRAALLADVDAAQNHYEAAAKTSRALARQVQQGIASIADAVFALGAAQRAQAQAAVDLAQSTVDSLTLRAPIGGVVQFARPSAGTSADPLASLLGAVGSGGSDTPSAAGATPVGVDDILVPGDRVSAGMGIVTIIDISEIGLVGEVDETDVLLVTPGITADVELDAAPGVRYEASVGTVDLLPTPSNRGGVAYRIRLSFAPTHAADLPTPRPGMSAVAHLHVRTATDAVAVPAAAVFSADGADEVWLIRNGAAVRQRVKVGVQGEDLVQILDGVEPGERVVVAGTDKVTVGLELK